MNEYLVYIALVLAFVFDFSFFFFISYIQKKKYKKKIRFLNTFMYEVSPRFNERESFVNCVLILGVIFNFFPFIYYMINNIQVYAVSLMIIASILLITLSFLPFIPLDRLKEHLYLDVGAFVLLFALTGLESYYGFVLYRFYLMPYQLVSAIIALVLAFIILIMIINPKLFDLKNDLDENGNPKRKRVIWLAFNEWLFYPLSILTLVPLLFLYIK